MKKVDIVLLLGIFAVAGATVVAVATSGNDMPRIVDQDMKATPAAPQATLLLAKEQAPGFCCYVDEGEVTFARVLGGDGNEVALEGFAPPSDNDEHWPQELRLKVEPGRYEVRVFFRTCSATCERLDERPLSEPRCATRLDLAGDEVINATVLVDERSCRVEITGVRT